ncbi:MAG: amidase [Thermoanaerobaculia bacterium]|nr:amidase [Thermoanaerobaculia bacterium]
MRPVAGVEGQPIEDLTAPGALEAFGRQFEETEARIAAFVDEPGRAERWHREVADLAPLVPATHPLRGVPIGVKDIFHVEGLPTRAGSRLDPEVLAGPEASSVTRLRNAGSLLVGKTTTTEFAYFAPAATRNPHALEHTPGGSSSGSAAAVASGQCRLALGTQTIGSIGRPASYCGIVGYKPSYDRVPRDGVIPLAPSLDHVGLLAADLGWAQIGAETLVPDWQGLTPMDVRARLAVPSGAYLEHCDRIGRPHFESVVARLECRGYSITFYDAFPDFEILETRHRRLLAAEVAEVHRDWYPRFRHLYRKETAELIERGASVSEEQIAADREARLELRHHLDEALQREGFDLWLSPAAPGPAPRGLDSTGNPILNLPWTQAGVPTLVIPTDVEAGLPLGAQLAGRFGGDEELFAFATLLVEDVALEIAA